MSVQSRSSEAAGESSPSVPPDCDILLPGAPLMLYPAISLQSSTSPAASGSQMISVLTLLLSIQGCWGRPGVLKHEDES